LIVHTLTQTLEELPGTDRHVLPGLPGIVAAGTTRQETEQLMIEAMAEHIALLRDSGEPVPEPSDSDCVTVLDPSAA
jgi:predicted RNase H-like HicB family nuclease